MSIDEKLIEGKYIFLKDGDQYSEEIFTVLREDSINGRFLFQSELLSRVPSGEFLKINVDYETTSNFDPLDVKVVRSLGSNFSTEHYRVDPKDKQVYYNFNGNDGSNDYERNVSGKFHISTPAFVTSALMTMMKKMNTTQATTYSILNSNNLWTYEGPFVESDISLTLKSMNAVEIKLNDSVVTATHCQLTENSEDHSNRADRADFFLSKHFNIPYQAKFPQELEVKIDRLKVFENDYKNMFK